MTIRLLDANRSAIRTKADAAVPFLLWDKADPAASRTLVDGVYYLESSIIGALAIRVTQSCPRPRSCPSKGMMMMMMARCPSSGMGMM
jgi:hypothetical protein